MSMHPSCSSASRQGSWSGRCLRLDERHFVFTGSGDDSLPETACLERDIDRLAEVDRVGCPELVGFTKDCELFIKCRVSGWRAFKRLRAGTNLDAVQERDLGECVG